MTDTATEKPTTDMVFAGVTETTTTKTSEVRARILWVEDIVEILGGRLSKDQVRKEIASRRMRGRKLGGRAGFVSTTRALLDWAEGMGGGQTELRTRYRNPDEVRAEDAADAMELDDEDNLPPDDTHDPIVGD